MDTKGDDKVVKILLDSGANTELQDKVSNYIAFTMHSTFHFILGSLLIIRFLYKSCAMRLCMCE